MADNVFTDPTHESSERLSALGLPRPSYDRLENDSDITVKHKLELKHGDVIEMGEIQYERPLDEGVDNPTYEGAGIDSKSVLSRNEKGQKDRMKELGMTYRKQLCIGILVLLVVVAALAIIISVFKLSGGQYSRTTPPLSSCASSPVFDKYCRAIVDYNLTSVDGYYGQQTHTFFEEILSKFGSVALSDSCKYLIMPFICQLAFPECDFPGYRLPPCKDYCAEIYKSCSAHVTHIMSEEACNKTSDSIDNCKPQPTTESYCFDESEHVCPNGALITGISQCISTSKLCDGSWDCDDGTDESESQCPRGITCPEETLECLGNGSIAGSFGKERCYFKDSRCSETIECTTESDEIGCTDNCTTSQWRCEFGYNQYTNSSCIDLPELCDNIQHCTDNSDEQDCNFAPCNSTTEFRCVKGVDFSTKNACVPVTYRCDETVECTDGSDEDYCYSTCPPDHFMCFSKKNVKLLDHQEICVANTALCDGEVDCDDVSDEHQANCTTCPNDGYRCTSGTSMNRVEAVCVEQDEWCEPGDATASCTPLAYVCDGKQDCSTNSDEADCPSRSCSSGYFHCETGAVNIAPNRGWCLPDELKCNGMMECMDGSDETNCPVCSAENSYRNCKGCPTGFYDCEMQAGIKGKCISRQHVCDADRDCADGRDEKGCGMRCLNKLQCHGRCFTEAQRCDGTTDCRHGADESECSNDGTELSCQGVGKFRCLDGFQRTTPGYESYGRRCIPTSHRCDRTVDCSDGSDEDGCDYDRCTDTQFKCVTGSVANVPYRGYCIGLDEVCDGYFECSDGSDEQFCQEKKCGPGLTRCEKSGVKGVDVQNGDFCISSSLVCDGRRHCTHSTDEMGCACPAGHSLCANGGHDIYNLDFCIPNSWRCDGADDCSDSSDETGCRKKRTITK